MTKYIILLALMVVTIALAGDDVTGSLTDTAAYTSTDLTILATSTTDCETFICPYCKQTLSRCAYGDNIIHSEVSFMAADGRVWHTCTAEIALALSKATRGEWKNE